MIVNYQKQFQCGVVFSYENILQLINITMDEKEKIM